MFFGHALVFIIKFPITCKLMLNASWLLSPNERPMKIRSQSATRARNIQGTYPTELPVVYENEERVENFHRPCIDARTACNRGAKYARMARKRRSKSSITMSCIPTWIYNLIQS